MNLRFFIAVCLLVLLALTPVVADQKSVTLTLQVNHTVALTWTASTSTVVGYRVYRAGVTGGPYSQITTQSGLSFTDTQAIAGQTYFYVVTAVDTNNNESANSNEAVAVIPTP